MSYYANAAILSAPMSKKPKIVEGDLQASHFAPLIGERLSMVVAIVGVSQSAIGREIGVDQSTVTKWLKGQRVPSVYQMALFCETYGCSLDFIYRGSLVGVRQDLAVRLAAHFPDLVLGRHAKAAEEEV